MANYYSPDSAKPLHSKEEFLVDDENNQYPIVNGIPRFVELENYANAFGYQWNKFLKTQLDSHSGTTITEERLKRCLGSMWGKLENKKVLECGCGAGRFTEVLLKQGSFVYSIDLSSAVEANQSNFPQNDQHKIAQASILSLPFQKEEFDFVICLGVLQHTPDSKITIQKLFEMVKPGGWLVVDHYAPTLSMRTKIGMFICRPFIKRMKPERAFKFVKSIVDFFFPMHKAFRNFYLGQIILSRVSPLSTYFHAYPELSDSLQYEWALLDTYDSLTDHYKHVMNADTLKKELTSLPLANVVCREGGIGVEGIGQRVSSSKII